MKKILETNPKKFFSLITVIKNAEKTLPNLMKSIDSQTFRDFEHIICVSTKNTDKTNEILSNHKNENTFIYNENECSINRYSALNQAISLSKGKFVMLMHGDDIFNDKKSLENISKEIKENKNFDVYYGNIKIVNISGKIKRNWIAPVSIERFIFKIFLIPHVSIIINKNKLLENNIKYDQKYVISSDLDYIIQIFYINKLTYKKLNLFTTKMLNTGDSAKYKFFIKKNFEDLKILFNYFKFKSLYLFFIKKFSKIFQLII